MKAGVTVYTFLHFPVMAIYYCCRNYAINADTLAWMLEISTNRLSHCFIDTMLDLADDLRDCGGESANSIHVSKGRTFHVVKRDPDTRLLI
jgi:hypothetical protein